MRRLFRYRTALAGLLLLIVSVPLFWQAAARRDRTREEIDGLQTRLETLQASIDNNMIYAGVQDKIDGELKKIEKSRQKLYSHFSSELLEEDQIRYVLYLESLFGNEMQFAFSDAVPITTLSDGSSVDGVTLTVNFQTTYENFKAVVEKLAADEQIASVQVASMEYVPESGMAVGKLTVTVYTLTGSSYEPPASSGSGTGKEKIFE